MKLIPLKLLFGAYLFTTLLAPSQAFTFDQYRVRAATFYGFVSNSALGQFSSKFTNAFTTSRNAVYGITFDAGRMWTKFNSKTLEANDIDKIVWGAEFIYSYLNSDTSKEVITSSSSTSAATATQSFKGKVIKNSLKLGTFASYYFFDTIYLRGALGLDQTFNAETTHETVNQQTKTQKIKTSYLTPYLSLGIGYDIGYLSNELKATYVCSRKQDKGYFTVILSIGTQFTFK